MNDAFVCIFGLIWSVLVLGFDHFVARDALSQFESRHYLMAIGTVTRSEGRTSTSSKGGTSYRAIIEYRFTVGKRSLFGDRVRYLNPPNDSASVSSLVVADPVGGPVPVFYNPVDPADALLLPGIEGRDLLLVIFLAPFNAAMLGFWVVIAGWLRERLFRSVAGGVKIIRGGMATRVRLPQYSAVIWGLATTGGLGFVSTFILGFSTGMRPSTGAATVFIVLVYLGGVAVYLWQRWKIASGLDDLVINESARTLELPPTCGRKQRVTANIADIEWMTVERITHTSSRGSISYTYAPSVSFRGLGKQKLADWWDETKANEFNNWLKKQLGR